MIGHGIKKSLSITFQSLVSRIGMFLHASKEPCYRFHKGIIIHDGIPLISLKPPERITIMLRKYHGIGISLFYHLSESLPEQMIIITGVAKISCNIKTPAINIVRRADPFLSDCQYLVFQLLGALIVELWKSVIAPPLLISVILRPGLVRIVTEGEIIMIRTILQLICTGLIIVGLILVVVKIGLVHPLVV